MNSCELFIYFIYLFYLFIYFFICRRRRRRQTFGPHTNEEFRLLSRNYVVQRVRASLRVLCEKEFHK
jgi:hypothetical protein